MANPQPSGKGQTVTPANKATTVPIAAIPKESKRAKFVRLGGIRVAKGLKAINVIGNLAGPGYEYGEADVLKIKQALENEVAKTMAKFAPKAPGQAKAVNVFAL